MKKINEKLRKINEKQTQKTLINSKMRDFCYDGVILYESNNFVWELILERHEYIVEIVNPSLLKMKTPKIVIQGVTFGTNY